MRSKNVDIGDSHMTNGTAKMISLYIASAIGTNTGNGIIDNGNGNHIGKGDDVVDGNRDDAECTER